MRYVTGAFGLICGAVIVGIVARYGYRTADNEFDGYIWAFFYAMLAIGGLFGHALSVRLCRQSKIAAGLVFIVAALALTINLSNSLGAMAGRGNEKQAARLKIADEVRDARRDLSRAEGEREALRFTPSDADTVEAARGAAKAASDSREAECAKRGPLCREREQDERRAAVALSTASANKAATDRAAQLDASIAAAKKRISDAGPVLEANPQGAAFARLFNLPDSAADFLSTWQNFAMGVVAELLIVLAMVSFEVLRPKYAPAPPSRPESRAELIEASPKSQGGPPELVVLDSGPESVPGRERLSGPHTPRLVASQSSAAASVLIVMADLLEPGEGKVEFAETFAAYKRECRRRGRSAATPDEFSSALQRLCGEMSIEIASEDDRVYLLRVRLETGAAGALRAVD
jgi:hypothetical protein